MLLLIATAIMVACTQDQELTKSSESESKITPRSTLGDSVFQAHNDFILWILDNHYDSAVYYASDDVDVIEFLERKRYQYVGGTSNISSVVIANGELIFQGPYYVEGSGFVNNYGAFSASWYTNLYLVMDSVINAVEANASESNVMPIIARGKIRVNAISGLANKENLINTLTQLQYSMALAYDIEDEYGDGVGNGLAICSLYSAAVDCDAFRYFAALGDTESDDPMFPFAMQSIAAVSGAAFLQCL